MAQSIKQEVTSNVAIIGKLSPYSYQVRPKTNRDPITVAFDGVEFQGRLTAGQGKGASPKFYAYFVVEGFQHWIELTAAAHAELKAGKRLNLFTVVAGTGPAPHHEAPKADEPAPAAAPPKGKRSKRESVAA